MRERRLAQAALRCYPQATREALAAEMLDTLLETSRDRRGVFLWNIVSLVICGLGQRARASARVSPGWTIVEATQLASVVYACLWLTAGLRVLTERSALGHEGRVAFHVVGLLIVLLAWSRGRQRLAGVIGLACAVLLVAAYPPAVLLPASLAHPMLPVCGFLIMAIAPARERPSTVALVALAGLVAVGVIVDGTAGGHGQLIVLGVASIVGLAVFAVQPRLAIALAMIWTVIRIEMITFGAGPAAPSKLLVVSAPAVLAATAVRAHVIRRRAI